MTVNSPALTKAQKIALLNDTSFFELCKSRTLTFRCHSELHHSELHEGARVVSERFDLDGLRDQAPDQDRNLHRLRDRGVDLIHPVLVAFPERSKLPDLQDEVDAHDHPARGPS